MTRDNLITYIEQCKSAFDFDNIYNYQMLIMLLYHSYDQEDELLIHEVKNIIQQLSNVLTQMFMFDPEQALYDLSTKFDIHNINDYQKLIVICNEQIMDKMPTDLFDLIESIILKIQDDMNVLNQEPIITYECSVCGLRKWRDKPIKLIPYYQIDDTIGFLCPNCYSQEFKE